MSSEKGWGCEANFRQWYSSQPEGLRVLSRERGSGWDTRAAEQPVKRGEGEQQRENEAQGADRGRRRKDRARSQLLKAEHKEQLPSRQGQITVEHSLSSEIPSCVGRTPLPQFSQRGAHQNVAPYYHSFIHRTQSWTWEFLNVYPQWTPLKCSTNMYWLISNSPHCLHPDMSNQQCAGGSYKCSLLNTKSSITQNATNSFCFRFFEINSMSLRPRHGKQWRLFSVSKGWTCLWPPLQ